jgi:hypothetical protein
VSVITSLDEASSRDRVVDVHGQSYRLREFVGAAPLRGTYVEGSEANADRRPQGFLVTQPPGSVTPPHFHESDQFQVFVGGDGMLGKRALRPVTVQFAGAHTPYGPIRAGGAGVEYYTLRQRWDPGAKYMPAMRARLVRGRQRQRVWELPEEDGRAGTALLAHEPDGLSLTVHALEPRATAPESRPDQGGGEYQVVLAGTLLHAGRSYGVLSVRHVATSDAPPPIVAGDDGLRLLVARFPRRVS